jgi:23S rRNA pseudouridine1911/1915/1917 synthase
MALVKGGIGKVAITQLSAERVFRLMAGHLVLSLLDCKLETGRTHQIRVHCQSIQCPLVGDALYGKPQYHRKKGLPVEVQEFARQALHAYQLSFIHPTTHELCAFSCPYPKDMQAMIDALDQEVANN